MMSGAPYRLATEAPSSVWKVGLLAMLNHTQHSALSKIVVCCREKEPYAVIKMPHVQLPKLRMCSRSAVYESQWDYFIVNQIT